MTRLAKAIDFIFIAVLLAVMLFVLLGCSPPDRWEMIPTATTPYDDQAEEYNQLRRLEKFCGGIGKGVDYLARKCK